MVKKAVAAPIVEEGRPSKALPVLPPRRKHVAVKRAAEEVKDEVVVKAAEEEVVVKDEVVVVVEDEVVVKAAEEEVVVEDEVVVKDEVVVDERDQEQKQQKQQEQKQQEEEKLELKKAELKLAAEEAMAATKAAAAAHDTTQTLANAEKVSDIVDDQLQIMREEAIEAVVEIVEAEDVAERAVEEADKVIEESKKDSAKPFPAMGGPPKKKSKKKKKGAEDEAEPPIAIEHVFTVDDLRGKTLSGKVTTDDKSQPLLPEEADDAVESLDEVECPSLSFGNAPNDQDENVGAKEKEIRDVIVHAHHLAHEAKMAQMSGNVQQAGVTMRKAIQKAEEAVELCVTESQANGNIRPSLVAATAFCLADVKTHAYGGRPPANELKVAFAVALKAIENSDEEARKGGKSKAYTQFGALMNMQQKPRSALASYLAAYQAAKADYGEVHEIVEQAKYDYTGYLAKCGRSRDCVDFLVKAARELEEIADAQEAEAEAKGEKEELVAPEDAQAGDAEGEVKKLPNYSLARHFATRNLLNAAGVLDTRGDHLESQEILADVLELAIRVHGENSRQHMNALYAIGTHCKAREAIEEAIACHEAVLNIMDATIQVYDPERLQNRVAILKDTAQLYDLQGQPEVAIEYAEGACVNAKTLGRIYAASSENFPLASRIGMMEPFWQLLIDLKTKVGDTEGAALARRELNKGKMNLTGAGQGQRGARRAPSSRSMGRARR